MEKKIANKPEPINNTERVTAFRARGGRIVHLQSFKGGHGMTVAFIPKNSRVELATSVQHRNDSFTKKIGTMLAIEHFNAGKTIVLPLNTGKHGITDEVMESLGYLVR